MLLHLVPEFDLRRDVVPWLAARGWAAALGNAAAGGAAPAGCAAAGPPAPWGGPGTVSPAPTSLSRLRALPSPAGGGAGPDVTPPCLASRGCAFQSGPRGARDGGGASLGERPLRPLGRAASTARARAPVSEGLWELCPQVPVAGPLRRASSMSSRNFCPESASACLLCSTACFCLLLLHTLCCCCCCSFFLSPSPSKKNPKHTTKPKILS